jgi:hypothetical protein
MTTTYYPGVVMPVIGIITEDESDLTSVAVSAAFLWNINGNPVSVTKTFDWHIYSGNIPGWYSEFNVHSRVHATQPSQFNVLKKIPVTQTCTFLCPKTVTRQKVIDFNVRERLVPGASKSFGFNTRERVTPRPQQQSLFNTRKKVTASVTSKFNTHELRTVQKASQFNVLTGNTTKAVYTYIHSGFNTLALTKVTASHSSAFNIRKHVTVQKALDFNVRQRVYGTDITVEFNAYKRVKPTVACAWNEKGRILTHKTCEFNVRAQVNA